MNIPIFIWDYQKQFAWMHELIEIINWNWQNIQSNHSIRLWLLHSKREVSHSVCCKDYLFHFTSFNRITSFKSGAVVRILILKFSHSPPLQFSQNNIPVQNATFLTHTRNITSFRTLNLTEYFSTWGHDVVVILMQQNIVQLFVGNFRIDKKIFVFSLFKVVPRQYSNKLT